MNSEFWRGRSVLMTGHTGFKGSWLTLWLNHLGARVHGYSLEPPTEPNLFSVANVGGNLVSHTLGDIRDLEKIRRVIESAKPEIVFHLAAQPIVRDSYDRPVETFAVNIIGTVNVLEASRLSNSVRAIVNVTTDKCYRNREWPWGYRETDRLGGRDPYSSSKACSELVTAAYRDSFFEEKSIAVATARAGNVIGGGDWGCDRLLPDFFRALKAKEALLVRNPNATRPWQYVLEPLRGYLQLAERLSRGDAEAADAWNFGPRETDMRTVNWIIDYLTKCVPGVTRRLGESPRFEETFGLRLDSSKAHAKLGWATKLTIEEALDRTVAWYLSWFSGSDMRELCLAEIANYQLSFCN